MNQQLPRVEVVTAFLRHAGKVLLLQRSDDVGSYPGRWAGVSGYLEDATPLAQALREIGEETGIAADNVRLAAQARPLDIPAPEHERRWVVHPFLFDIDDPDAVQLDWESAGCAWVEPQRLAEYATVPMLAEALQACLNEERQHLPDAFAERVAAVADDRTHGAAELGRRCLEILAEAAQRTEAEDAAALRGALHDLAAALMQSRPSMTPLQRLVSAWLERCDAAPSHTLSGLRASASSAAHVLISESRKATQAAAANAADLLAPCRTLVTHSYSSTVSAAIALLRADVQIIFSEARPLYDGHRLAGELSERARTATLVTDAQLGLAVQRADAVLVGADTVMRDGSVVNKAGTLMLAATAAYFDVPLYACCETFKLRTADMPALQLERMAPGELGAPDWPGVTVENVYFDVTPPALIHSLITESGVTVFPGYRGEHTTGPPGA